MNHAIAQQFTARSLIQFALPTTIMMIFVSLYTIVDGMFVSRFVGPDALSALNIVYPFTSVLLAVSIMFGTGGSAIVAKRMGEGDYDSACRIFTWLTLCLLAMGTVLALCGLLWIGPLVRLLGADEALAPMCIQYLGTLLLFTPAYVLQLLFQTYFVTAGKPKLGLTLTVLAGVTNAVLDYVFMVPCGMGVLGAALATAIGYLIPSVSGILFFCQKRHVLHFARPALDWRALGQACANGSSEMVTNLSTSVTTLLFNLMMMRYLGTSGVAAITAVMYCQFLLTSLYMGFSIGTAPVVSYNYGSQDTAQLRRLFRICIRCILVSSCLIFAAALLLAPAISALFMRRGTEAYAFMLRGFYLCAPFFLCAGVNIYASAYFTALGNGLVSALISFSRTFLFLVPGILLLPYALGADGIWCAIPAAEVVSLVVSISFLLWGRRRYGY